MAGERQRGLGRGLGALIPTDAPRDALSSRPSDVFFEGSRVVPRDLPAAAASPALSRPASLPGQAVSAASGNAGGAAAGGGPGQPASPAAQGLRQVPGVTFAELPCSDIRANAQQPRTVFDEEELDELAANIRQIGVLQPVVVRPADGDPPYELIMGERRWRAARQAGLTVIPAIIRSAPDNAMLRDALLENLHRAQLNPLEEAAAYQQLLEDFGCTHDELATRLSRSRPQISNTLRLLRLPAQVQRRVAAGVLTAGHARALLGLSDAEAMERLAQRIVAEGLSVRSVEEIVAVATDESVPAPRSRRTRQSYPEFDNLAALLADRLDTRVSINMGRTKGKLTVEFASREDLDRILLAIRDVPDAAAGESEDAS